MKLDKINNFLQNQHIIYEMQWKKYVHCWGDFDNNNSVDDMCHPVK